MNNLKELYQNWKNIKEKMDNADISFTLPNYFLKMSDNDSLDKIAKEVSEELEKLKLFDYSCDTHYYVFCLNVPKLDDDDFPSFRRLFRHYTHELSKFNITYNGAIFIDITEWIRKHAYNRNQFKDFLEFVSVIQSDASIFFVSQANWQDNEPVYNIIQKKMRLEKAEVKDDFTQQGVDFIKKLASNRDIKFEDKALKALPEMIATILRVRGNRASTSIRDVFYEILYQKSKNAPNTLKTINFNDIKDYLKGGKFEELVTNTTEGII